MTGHAFYFSADTKLANNIKPDFINPTTLTVSWDPLSNSNEIDYIRVTRISIHHDEFEFRIAGNANAFNATNLEPSMFYTFLLTAVNKKMNERIIGQFAVPTPPPSKFLDCQVYQSALCVNQYNGARIPL